MKICLVGSSGGHLSHLYSLKPLWSKEDRFWVTFDKEDARSILKGERTYHCFFPTNRNVKNLIRNTLLALKVIYHERPDLIISSGAAVAVPFFYIGKLFGSKTVYIEVFDRMDAPTLTGKLVYHVSDLFIVQWEEMKKVYPKAINLGGYLLMIFVTVGTHEQQFDRLIKAVDKLAGAKKFKDSFLVQSGYSTYKCRNCNQKKFMSYSEMEVAMEQARIVICHGGPSTFMKSLSLSKGTIVVPRRKKYAEHVNDHQLHFAEEVVRKGYPIEVVENVNQLESAIRNCTNISQETVSNNKHFNDNLMSLVNKMMVK